MKSRKYMDAKASWSNDTFTIENAGISRTLTLKDGYFFTESFYDKSAKTEWVSGPSGYNDFSYRGLLLDRLKSPLKLELVKCDAEILKNNIFTEDCLCLKIYLKEPLQNINIIREYLVFPEIPVIQSRTKIKSPVIPNFYSSLCRSHNIKWDHMENCTDCLSLKKSSLHGRCVAFFGRTDQSNELVREESFKLSASSEMKLSGNMLFLKDNSSDNGLFMVQEAPSTGERRHENNSDFIYRSSCIKSLGWGILPSEFKDEEMTAYSCAAGVFSGDFDNASVEVKKFFVNRFRQSPEKYRTMANPWGGGGEIWQKNISDSFVLKEIEAAAEMGLEMYQVDDGWQENRSLSEMTSGNKPMSPADWQIRKDIFPSGFSKIKKACDEKNVEFCLWFAPSFNKSYRDWEEQVELLYGFYKKYGIKTFKIDATVVNSKEAEENLEKLLRSLRLKTGGDIYFNLDTTSGMRPGYLLFQEYGNVFLENRYQSQEGLRSYLPSKAMRNLWLLSRYIPSQRLQVEFTDMKAAASYKKVYKGTGYPEKFTQEYVSATTLFASPLCWAYPSEFDAASRKSVRRVMELHKKIRNELYESVVIPVGEEPSGKSWSGFQAHNFRKNSGLLIVYREMSRENKWIFSLKYLNGKKVLLEEIPAEGKPVTHAFKGNAEFQISLETENSFRLYKYKVVK
ncbi:MAG: hypothetical protein A2017_20725 [Lentisphaerae bacterium GWF2_44_16]|nr:MAG: hypothetical protein A2017_20725 [Lentisphaerae bacterium GWF2_44_16]